MAEEKTRPEKVDVSLEDLKSLAETARLNGTEHAFMALALEWAEAAANEVAQLRNDNIALQRWVEEGDALFARQATPMFKLGEWWADRPWRERKL